MEFELFFSDLTENAQKELLKKAGLKNETESNWDVFPIATIILGDE